jgi:hypothetical protein
MFKILEILSSVIGNIILLNFRDTHGHVLTIAIAFIFIFQTIAYMISSAASGIMQWFVIKKEFNVTNQWVMLTIIGSFISFLISSSYTIFISTSSTAHNIAYSTLVMNSIVLQCVDGFILGFMQSFALHKVLTDPGKWVLYSVIGMFGNGIMMNVLPYILRPLQLDASSDLENPVFWVTSIIAFMIYGLITGHFWVHRLEISPKRR